MTPRKTHQFDLFQNTDAAPPLPVAIEAEVFALLVQLLQLMIPILAREVDHEQDHS
ncbi:hypothetical protein [Ferrovibrio sp.]|uniref:hypothetical protein n=1 Tax=Ferrovibrio sp. TaxID=1917215 RepID=UPI0025BCF657|nr:hypothetical protein [Ferrovibrio sp.]